MINFALGVAVGAAFAPFWMSLWKMFVELPVVKSTMAAVAEHFNKPKP